MTDISHDRFVAHLDILGMSAIVERDHEEAWKLLSALVHARDSATNTTIEFVDRGERVHVPEQVRAVTFSDTIVLFTRGASESDLHALVITVTELFYRAIYNHVPIRAGIALGTFYFNVEKSMYAGPALIDAYRTGEAAQWLGIAFSSSLQGREKLLDLTTGKSSVIVDWPVPLKDGTVYQSVVNWPACVVHNFRIKPPITTAQLYSIFEPMFGPISDLPRDVVAKYSNTVEFINAQCAAHEA